MPRIMKSTSPLVNASRAGLCGKAQPRSATIVGMNVTMLAMSGKSREESDGFDRLPPPGVRNRQ
jgi:hypothetical protein